MAKALDLPSLYDTDYVAWLEEQVAHLRAGHLAALDVDNVAEELESLLNSQRQQLENRLEVLIHHLLKWDHQPDQRSNRWRATVQEQRTRIRRLLRFSPSLRPEVESMTLEVYPDALRAAAIETRLSEDAFPAILPYSVEEIIERDLPAEELSDQRSTRKKSP
jgi:nitric oxide reductase activation protein